MSSPTSEQRQGRIEGHDSIPESAQDTPRPSPDALVFHQLQDTAQLPPFSEEATPVPTTFEVLIDASDGMRSSATEVLNGFDGNVYEETATGHLSVADGERVDFRMHQWHHVEGCWPRRLLHIPTMTSFEREQGNRYGGTKEPSYSILSYTWGRWAGHSDGPRLGIKGVTWAIPAIDENHFAVQSFERVVQQLGRDSEYVWLDIACIDQENDVAKMDEVRRQVGIFANARRVYIWLSRLSTAHLVEIFDTLRAFEKLVGNRVFGKRRLTNVGEPLAYLPRLCDSVTALLKDPWFSSLWTLQEGTLRQDAVVLSREGNTMTHNVWGRKLSSDHESLSQSLYRVADFIRELSERPEWERDDSALYYMTAVADVIHRAGYDLPRGQNPNIQYGIAQYRETSFPCDRIYGIMAIYGIEVGQENPYGYTFDELEQEFAATLNATSPFIGQIFLHTAKPKENASWKITQQSRVPMADIDPYPSEVQTLCTISAAKQGPASFSGSICLLTEWVFVTLCRTSVSPLYEETKRLGEYYGASYWFTLLLDDYVSGEYPSLSRSSHLRSNGKSLSPQDAALSRFLEAQRSNGLENPSLILSLDLCSLFGKENVYVLLLGEIPSEMRNDENVEVSFGVILLHNRDGEHTYKRLGICQWRGDIDGRYEPGDRGTYVHWKSMEGRML